MTHSRLKSKVIVLSTGGTIEKTYSEIDGSLENRQSNFQRLINRLRLPYMEVEIHEVMNKDSLEMDDNDRQEICNQIEFFMERKHPIIVVHGTDTMSHTMQYCANTLQSPDVPVIFTGAMRPQELEGSDALQNVTESLLAAKMLTPGYFIVFHNEIFDSMNVRKNPKKATFETF